MTEKLYYNDAYIKEFTATVLACTEARGGFSVVLDRTAFFPEEGGQYSDRGYIASARVERVWELDGVIYHMTDRPLAALESVACRLDFEERYEKMQCHTAEHIISGIIHKRYGMDNVGFHLSDGYVTMDVSGVLDRTALDGIEDMANEAVYRNLEVSSVFPAADELRGFDYRAKLDITEGVRIVNIGDVDSCACCAPHVKRTGEIGAIKLLDFERLRGGTRIYITAGRRALMHYRSLFREVSEISALLSVPKDSIADGVRKLRGDLEAERAAFKSYKLERIKKEASKIASTEGNAVLLLDGASPEELRVFASEAVSKIGGILVALSGEAGAYKYVIASNTQDLRPLIKDINSALSGRGGGSSSMAQGSFSESLDEIKRYFVGCENGK